MVKEWFKKFLKEVFPNKTSIVVYIIGMSLGTIGVLWWNKLL